MNSNNIIMQNKIKVFMYMVLMTAIIVVLGYYISEYFGFGLIGIGISLIVAGLTNFIAYFFSDVFVIKSSGAVEIKCLNISNSYVICAKEIT